MPEVEYGGVKVSSRGFLGKLFWILPLMGTLAGGSWAVFEFYKDYEDLQEAVQEFVSPDFSYVDDHMASTNAELKIVEKEFELLKEVDQATSAVIREQINSVKAIAANLQTDLHDLRMDLNQDVAEVHNSIEVEVEKVNANLDKQEARLEKQDARNRQSVEDVNKTSSDNVSIVRGLIVSSEERRDKMVDRLDIKIAETQAMMDTLLKENRLMIEGLKAELDKKIRLALENPLSGMSK